MEKTVLLADDHYAVRDGMRLLCEQDLGLKNIDEASSCSQIMNRLKNKQFTHLILDLTFLDGTALEIIPTIRNLYPDLRIIIFSVHTEDIYKKTLSKYGVYDFITKSASKSDAIQRITGFINNDEPKRAFKKIDKTSPLMNLSARELEVTHYLVTGSSVNQIGASLNLKQSTVSTYKHRILQKCNVDNILDLKELTSAHSLIEGSGKDQSH